MWQWIKEALGFEHDDAGMHGKYEVYAIRMPASYSPGLTSDGTIYIGSGVYPTRKEQHLLVARRKLKTHYGRMKLDHKEKLLIWAEDNAVKVEYVTLWRTNDREEAFCVENKTINHYGIEKLTNRMYGHCNEQALRNSKSRREYCRVCGIPLELDVNISAKLFARKDYICRECRSRKTRKAAYLSN